MKTNVRNLLAHAGAWLRKNWLLCLISLVSSIVIWDMVITDTDPVRSTTVDGLTVAVQGNTTLQGRDLTVSLSQEEAAALQQAYARLSMARSEMLSSITPVVHLTVDVSNISAPGTYTLPVHGESDRGTVVGVNPASVQVTVEEYATRIVAIDVTTLGNVADGFWRAPSVKVDPTVLQISGPKSQVSRIARARVLLNVTDAQAPITASSDFVLLDGAGEAVEQTYITLGTPNCILSLNVLPTKQVPVVYEGALVGQPERGYEILSVQANPATLTLVGSAAALAQVEQITLDPQSVEGITATRVLRCDVPLPAGVQAVEGTTVAITVEVDRQRTVRTFADVPVQVRNLAPGLRVNGTYSAAADITCTVLQQGELTRDTVALYVDATGLAAGTHTLVVRSDTATHPAVLAVAARPALLTVEIVAQ